MILQAYIDDSVTSGGMYVLAGHIATPEAWHALSKDWKNMLPRFGVLDKDGNYHFKMKEMVINEERKERIPAFYNVIHQHVLCSLSCAFDIRDLKRAKDKIFVPNLLIDWGDFENPYFVAFRALMDMFHSRRKDIESVIGLEQKVDFIFDEQQEKNKILSNWDSYMESRAEGQRQRYGAKPLFENDKQCMPLQAADLWAWCVRKWMEEGTPEKMDVEEFGAWKTTNKQHIKIHMSFNESELVTRLRTH